MARGKYLSLEEARKADQLKQLTNALLGKTDQEHNE